MLHTARIKELKASVVDQIAAGEVVDRPAQIVKELVENAIDAKATEIRVEFSNGGRNISVSDNGSGIHPDDVPLSLLRFTTSKITQADDLWSLSSFGFRGEALSSMASVSKLTLTSRQPHSAQGVQMTSYFGAIAGPEMIGADHGTSVRVEDLFENLPARKKFLKTAAHEHAQIRNYIRALALGSPEITFRVFNDQQLLDYWSATEDKQRRCQQILEIPDLLRGQAELEGLKVEVYLAKPEQSFKTSKKIWIFVQGRWVQDRGVQAAINEAYRNYLMQGQFPAVVCYITAEPQMVDVNIHPTKSQVKFVDSSNAFRVVQRALRQSLENHFSNLGRQKTFVNEDQFHEQISLQPQSSDRTRLIDTKSGAERGEVTASLGQASGERTATKSGAYALKNFAPVQYSQKLSVQDLKAAATDRAALFAKEPGRTSGTFFEVPQNADLSSEPGAKIHWQRLQVLAQAGLTYLVCQDDKGLIFVDQHAAHERILFEKIMKAWLSGGIEVQRFLFPIPISLSAEGIEALFKFESELSKIGMELEKLGPGEVGVSSCAAFLKDDRIPEVLQVMSDEILKHGGSLKVETMMSDLAASMACHSAIRAGQTLSLEEMKNLLVQMDESPVSSYCPHGRPVSVEYSFNRMEKDFGRIPG